MYLVSAGDRLYALTHQMPRYVAFFEGHYISTPLKLSFLNSKKEK